MIDCELVVAAKHPEVGAVKTRLARAIGERPACELYRAFVSDIVTRLGAGPHAFAFAYTPADAAFESYGMRSFAQAGATLDARLVRIFDVQRARARKTIVIGSDSPHVSTAWVARGFAALDDVDVVLGPCDDGGYWCVGMRESHDIFSGIAMSTPHVLAQTLKRVRALGLRYELLPTTFDVDEIDDLARLRSEVAGDPTSLPATRAVLATIPNVTLMTADRAPLLAQIYFTEETVSPIVAALAHVPEFLEVAMPLFGTVLGDTSLPTRLKELVVLRASSRNGCAYCTAAHSVIARDAGLTAEEAAALRLERPLPASFDARERAVVAFTDAICARAPDAIEHLRPYFEEYQIVEFVTLGSVTIMLNAFATTLALPTSGATTES